MHTLIMYAFPEHPTTQFRPDLELFAFDYPGDEKDTVIPGTDDDDDVTWPDATLEPCQPLTQVGLPLPFEETQPARDIKVFGYWLSK